MFRHSKLILTRRELRHVDRITHAKIGFFCCLVPEPCLILLVASSVPLCAQSKATRLVYYLGIQMFQAQHGLRASVLDPPLQFQTLRCYHVLGNA